MSNTNILSIKELIDKAFGNFETNVVHFKIIHTVLILLARQLRVLERQVAVDVMGMEVTSSESIIVTEYKITSTKRKKPETEEVVKGKGMKSTLKKEEQSHSGKSPSSSGRATDKTQISKYPTSKTTSDKMSATSLTDESTSDRSTTGKSSAEKPMKGKPTTSKSTTVKSTTDKSTTDKSTTDRSTTDKSITDKSTTDKSTTDRSTTDKSTTDKSTTDRSTTDRSTTDKSTTDRSTTERSTTERSTTDKSTTDKSSTTKSTTDKSTTDKSSTIKSTTDKSTTDKSSTTKSSTDKSSTITSSKDKSTTEKSSTDTPSADQSSKVKSTTDKSSKDKSAKYDSKKESLTDKSSSDVISTDKSDSRLSMHSKKDTTNYLELYEELTERELRIINQRADSKQLSDKSPIPMASAESIGTQEKILVVKRGRADRSESPTRKLGVVTEQEFQELQAVVEGIKTKLGPIPTSRFPENIQLMEELHKGASLTDAMAALQLSARLEAAEKTLQRLMSLVTDVAASKGLNLANLEQGVKELTVIKAPPQGLPPSKPAMKQIVTQPASTIPSEEIVQFDATGKGVAEKEEKKDYIIHEDLETVMEDLYDEVMTKLSAITKKNAATADAALRLAHKLNDKLEAALNLGDRMTNLEALVANYAEQITVLDTGLSSQMSYHQEQLTQMQYDLEAGIDAMAEALSNRSGENEDAVELNARFTTMQSEIEDAVIKQKQLNNVQDEFSLNLQDVWKQIESIRETKSDREEVADAFRDKAGISDLNGLVSLQQFASVRGDFENRISQAYEKFNNQESIWQKAIDELVRELNEKADGIQLDSLRIDIDKHLNKLNDKINEMFAIVGEPRAAALSRKLHRETECLSCTTPAHMDLEEPNKVPKLPAFPGSTISPTMGEENPAKPREYGDHERGVCYPGLPLPHLRDPRAQVCQRYCGGSHTRVTPKLVRVQSGLILTPLNRRVSTALGNDGKPYLVDDVRKPCMPCNTKNPSSIVSDCQHDDLLDVSQRNEDISTPPASFLLVNDTGISQGHQKPELSTIETPPMLPLYDQ